MERKQERKEINLKLKILIAICIGLFSFVIIYGITSLDVTNDSWIMAGYDEADIIQHYSGWLAFRNSEWSFPIGLAKDMAAEDGTFISYTDSIPWVAIFFKTFSSILPSTFQYFGLYALLCYILQSLAALEIVYFKTKNIVYSSIAVLLFSFAPILLERSLRHTALGSQWLILFAILIFIRHRENFRWGNYFWYLLLMVLAIGIHPYFLPTIAVFLLVSMLEDMIKNKKYLTVLCFISNLILTYFSGCVLGVLGTGVSPTRGGFGHYSMNLNAIFNPTSCGGYRWSAFLKVRPQILGNYDGFNYLGMGIFLLFFVVIIFAIIFKISGIKDWIKENKILLLMFSFCTLFALSNVITFNDKILLSIQLPEKLAEICGIFRASSRIFYPVYYSVFIAAVLLL